MKSRRSKRPSLVALKISSTGLAVLWTGKAGDVGFVCYWTVMVPLGGDIKTVWMEQ